MQGSFSFCGVDVATLGIRYAPDMTSTYVYTETWNPSVQTFEGFHGGIYYGETVQPKEFKLRCYFEDQNVNEGVLDRVYNLFFRGRTGRLVFRERPWLWYTATSGGIDVSQLRNYRNGFVTITLRAYYPFARCDYLTLEDLQEAEFDTESDALSATASFLSRDALPPLSFDAFTGSKVLYLHNPGTEYADLSIGLAGGVGETAGNHITVTNVTTGHTCKFVSFKTEDTTGAGKWLVCDGLNGKTILTDGATNTLAFQYHDSGFIQLAPSGAVVRSLQLTADGNRVSGYDFTEADVGKSLMLDEKWYKIKSVEDGDAILDDDGTLYATQSFTSDMTTMNELLVTMSGEAQVDRLFFSYKPTFR